MKSQDFIIKVKKLSKIYKTDLLETTALDNVSFKIKKGEFVAIMGPSGSGKSTLMHILGALDKPTSGEYILDGEKVEKLTDDELSDIRNRKIGFVFQAFNLLPRTTTLKNVMIPMIYGGIPKEIRLKIAEKYLKMVGLGDRMQYTSNQISGGQQQRVAIARALIMSPRLILADEPTGNLDSKSGEVVLSLIRDLNHKEKITVIIVTHDMNVAKQASRIIKIRDGKIER